MKKNIAVAAAIIGALAVGNVTAPRGIAQEDFDRVEAQRQAASDNAQDRQNTIGDLRKEVSDLKADLAAARKPAAKPTPTSTGNSHSEATGRDWANILIPDGVALVTEMETPSVGDRAWTIVKKQDSGVALNFIAFHWKGYEDQTDTDDFVRDNIRDIHKMTSIACGDLNDKAYIVIAPGWLIIPALETGYLEYRKTDVVLETSRYGWPSNYTVSIIDGCDAL